MSRTFDVLPAIDLQGGRCVRLRQGRAEESTVYGEDPEAMARRWAGQGARWLHVVDLDGAFAGKPAHAGLMEKIVRAAGIAVEWGGGLRETDDLRRALDAGVRRVVVGTSAWAQPERLAEWADLLGDALAVGIDARDGRVQVRGWTDTTDVLAVDLARRASELGVKTVICTDTATDGMLTGPNLDAMEAVCRAASCRVIASGGVSRVEDVRALMALPVDNLRGAIVGKALYEGRTALSELLAAAEGEV